MKVYIITKCCSGEDYEQDKVEILGVFNNKTNACKAFVEFADGEIENCGDDEYESDTADCGSHYFELTNFDSDYHIILQLHTEECNCTFTTGLGRRISF